MTDLQKHQQRSRQKTPVLDHGQHHTVAQTQQKRLNPKLIESMDGSLNQRQPSRLTDSRPRDLSHSRKAGAELHSARHGGGDESRQSVRSTAHRPPRSVRPAHVISSAFQTQIQEAPIDKLSIVMQDRHSAQPVQ